MGRARKLLIIAGVLAAALAAPLALLTIGGEHEGPGQVHPQPRPDAVVARQAADQAAARALLGLDDRDKQICSAIFTSTRATRSMPTCSPREQLRTMLTSLPKARS